MSDAAAPLAVTTSPTRRRPSVARVAAAGALLLAVGSVVVPAHAADDGARSGRTLSDYETAGLGAARPGEPVGGPRDEVRLDASPTTQGGTGTARVPQVLSRSANLWMSQEAGWETPDEKYVDSIDVTQDVRAKTITVSAEYDAPPTASQNSDVVVWFGTWDAEEDYCLWQMGLAATAHSESSVATAEYKGGGSAGTASRALSGSTLTVTLSGGAAANPGYGCVYAGVFETELDAEGSSVLISSGGADDFDAEMEKAPEFSFYSSELNAAYPGKWNKVYVSVRNDGDLDAKNVKLKLSGKKLTFKSKTVKIGTIKTGTSKNVNVRVKLKGKKTRAMKVKATATGKWSATTSTKVGFRPLPTKVKSLVGTSYWTAPTRYDIGWDVYGLTFVDKTWVYQGVPAKGTPKCSSKVKECKKYSYSAKTGALKIGKLRAKVDSEGVDVTKAPKTGAVKAFYSPLKSPKKNSRIKASLVYNDFSGCGASSFCSTWSQALTLKKNGSFSWTYSAIHSSGFPPYQTFVTVVRPTKKGTYTILTKNRIRFTYVDEDTGKKVKEVHTIGIDSNALGKFAPKYGLLIGDMPHL